MAAPAVPSSVTLVGDYRVAVVEVVAGDATADRLELEVSWNDGTDWEHHSFIPGLARHFTVLQPPENVTMKARVRAVSAAAEASAWVTSTAINTGEAPVVDESGGTDIVLVVGELAQGTAAACSAAGLTAAGLGGLTHAGLTLDAIAGALRTLLLDAPELKWPSRNSTVSLPLRAGEAGGAFIWNHIGNEIPITAITPNSPSSGKTQVTLGGSIGRNTGSFLFVTFTGTGVANMDGKELRVEVTSATTAVIHSFTASSSSSTGKMRRPSPDIYDADQNGATDWRAAGAYPSQLFGLEAEVLRLGQNARSTVLGDGSKRPLLCVQASGGHPLLSRIVGSSASSNRWSKRFSGKSGSKWDALAQLLVDVEDAIAQFPTTFPAPYNLVGVVLGAGINETASDVTAIRSTHSVAAISVNAGVARVRTAAAHGLSNPVGQLYHLARISAVSGSLGAVLTSKIVPVSVVDSDEVDILDYDVTGLTATLDAGASIEIGAPIFWLKDLLTEHVGDLRDLAVSTFNPTQDPESIPVAILEPHFDEQERALEELLGSAAAAVAAYTFPLSKRAVLEVSSDLPKCGVVGMADIPRKFYSPSGLSGISSYYPGHVGELMVGQRAYEVLGNPSTQQGAIGQPGLVVVSIGHSFLSGSILTAWKLLGNPELLSPQGTEIPNVFEWDHTLEDIVPILVDPDLDPTYQGRANLLTNPRYNPGLQSRASFQVPMLQELRLRWPDVPIYHFNFGVNGSTAAAHTSAIPGGEVITAVTLQASTVTITVQKRGPAHDINPIARSAPFSVSISGVTGLSPAINGTFIATPVNVSSNPPPTNGTNQFTIAVAGVTGTPNVSAARASFPEVIWDPAVGDAWAEMESQALSFIARLQALGVRPDPQLCVVALAENDAAIGIEPADYRAAMQRIIDELRRLFTFRVEPRTEVPIVMLELIDHGRSTLSTETIAAFKSAQRSLESSNTRVKLLNVDEQNDRLADRVTISADRIHPDLAGQINLGYLFARKLDDLGAPPIDFGRSGSGNVLLSVNP